MPCTPHVYWVFGFSVIILYGHTNALLLIASGANLRTVAARLGHAQTSTTANIYSHAIKTTDAIASDALERVLLKKAAF